MLIPKEIARPGVVWYMDHNDKPAALDITAKMIDYWYDQGRAMLDAGLSIPVPLEHQPDAVPRTAAQKAAKQLLNQAGEVSSFLKKDGRLYGMLDIQDADVAKKIPKPIRYTSPWINSFTDGDNKKWDGVITHVALTSRPRIHRQEPFQSIAAALSVDSLLPLTREPLDAFISRAGLLKKDKKGHWVPAYPIAFSIWSGVKLAEDYPEEKKEPEKPPAKPSDEEPAEKSDEADDPLEVNLESDPEDVAEMGLIDVLRDVMSAMYGIELPEGVDEKNLLPHLIKASMEHLKTMTGNGDMEDEMEDPTKTTPPPEVKPPPSPVVQEQAPMFMSIEQIQEEAKKVQDPAVRRLLEASLSLNDKNSKRTDALSRRALDEAKVRRDQRIEKLVKRVHNDAFREKILAQVQGAQLSLADDGTVTDPLGAMLDVLETGIKNMPAMLMGGSGDITEHQHPEEYQGPSHMSEDRRKAVVAELAKGAGVPLTSSAN